MAHDPIRMPTALASAAAGTLLPYRAPAFDVPRTRRRRHD